MNAMFLFMALIPTQDAFGIRFSHIDLPLHGTVHNGAVHGFFGKRTDDFGLDAIPIDNPPKSRSKYYWLHWGQGSPGVNFRHHIRHDSIWISTGYVAVSRLKFSELGLFDPKNQEGYFKAYPGERPREFHQILTEKLYSKYSRLSAPISGYAKDVLGFNIVPTSDNTCKCCILTTQAPKIEVWDTQFRWNEKKRLWDTTEDGKNTETIDCLFKEDFYFFVRKDAYYFVTQSGQLFHAPPVMGAEKSRRMEALWTNVRRPIVAIIEDADNDKVWLFAKDKHPDAKGDLYFEIERPKESKVFDPKKLRPVNVDGRAKALLEYLPLILPEPKKREKKG